MDNKFKNCVWLTKFFIWLGHSSLYEYAQAYLNFQGNYIYQHYLNILFVNDTSVLDLITSPFLTSNLSLIDNAFNLFFLLKYKSAVNSVYPLINFEK